MGIMSAWWLRELVHLLTSRGRGHISRTETEGDLRGVSRDEQLLKVAAAQFCRHRIASVHIRSFMRVPLILAVVEIQRT